MSICNFHDVNVLLRRFKTLESGNPVSSISFVTPLLAVSLCGAFRSRKISREQFSFAEDAHKYARSNGLLALLGDNDETSNTGILHGFTYCPIQSLSVHAEVDNCNKVLSGLLQTQLSGCTNQKLVRATCAVIGEIHDNVASHARGPGFSAAQVYKGKEKQIQIAVADIGQGIRNSLGPVWKEKTDKEALEWCLIRGNTRTKLLPQDEDLLGPQKLDCLSFHNPYPEHTNVRYDDNHHMGEGLYRLVELIRETGGKTWIWSGNASMLNDKGTTTWIDPGISWSGTIVAIEIPIVAFESSPVAESVSSFENLAKMLGL
jgi:hypothetical protein